MARRLAELPKGSRITDHISLGVIAKTFPMERMKAILVETGRASRRQRELPGACGGVLCDCVDVVHASVLLPRRKALPDGSYLSQIYPSEKDRRHKSRGVWVRVIEYTLEGVPDAEPLYRLITTILDPDQAPADELAALYHERWEIENALDEFKTHLRGRQIVLRSKTPDLVRQEFYGLLLAHFAIRGLMHEAALVADEDPDRLSFTHTVNVVRRKLSARGGFVALPPSGKANPS